MKERQGIQSVEVGVRLLRALAESTQAMTLKDLAGRAGMPASKAHRYLVSFGRAGLVEQDPVSGRYDLGSLALHLGLAALGRLDAVKVATAALAELRARIDDTLLLAVWGNRGPAVIRWEESSRPVTVNVRVGSVMPLLSSATGRVFLAYQPEAMTKAMVAAELAGKGPGQRAARMPSPRDVARLKAETRANGLSRVEGDLLAGVSALAAPILDHTDSLVAVLTALGPQDLFDSRLDGPVAAALREVAQAASRRLGSRAEKRSDESESAA